MSSSPTSPAGLGAIPRSAPDKSIPSPTRPSPLSASFQLPLPSTSFESRTSVSSSNDHPDWSLRPPLLFSEHSTASHPDLSLLLQPVHISSSPRPPNVDELERTRSTSTGSAHSLDKNLDAAVRDAEHLLRITADGTVEAGTLEGLVDRVIKDTDNRAKDCEFKRVFLATYHLFSTGEDLFKRLKRRLEETRDVRTSILSVSNRHS
jgi:hypothetical protein